MRIADRLPVQAALVFKARPVHFFDDGTPGRKLEPVATPLGRVGVLICFDGDYSDIARKLTAAGAEFLAVPTYDAASWSAVQHLQHAVLFRLRAAENGRWLVSAASSGVSQVVDLNVNVHASLGPMEVGALTHRIGRDQRMTFFTRAGWTFPCLNVFGTVILLSYGPLVLFRIGSSSPRP